jgi:hypothetical protein
MEFNSAFKGLIYLYLIYIYMYVYDKGRFHPKTGHEDPEGEEKYISTISLTLPLDGVGGERHAPAALYPGKTRYLLYGKLSGSHGRSGRVRNVSFLLGLDSRTVQPLARRYNEYAIPADIHNA